MSVLDDTKISLRIMEKAFSSNMFSMFASMPDDQRIRYSSLSERLSTINEAYFREVFHHVFDLSKRFYANGLEPYHIRPFDSTSLSLSEKLLT